MKAEDVVLKGKGKKPRIKRVEEMPTESESTTQDEYESMDCPKCGMKKVISWTEQTRASDEPPTRFYRCTKCGHTWREYS